jgi:RimJ/RimL family protein N-acetyltransferase
MITEEVFLREVEPGDLPIFFEYEQDPVARHMAAFTSPNPADRAAFDAHWARIMADPALIAKTIVAGGQVAGNAVSYNAEGRQEVGYWLGRPFWGRGIASRALAELLALLPMRPLHARAAADNGASLRVLQKCGFVVVGQERGYANARGQEIDELVLELAE